MNNTVVKGKIIGLLTILISLGFWMIINTNTSVEFYLLNTVYINYKFLDLACIMFGLETYNLGGNPFIESRLDPLGRGLYYGPWWLFLAPFLDSNDTIWLGMFISSLTILVFAISMSPKNITTLGLTLSAIFSPPIVLGLTRGNNDLWIYLIITLSSICITQKRILLSYGLNFLCFGLKFYPLFITPYPLTFLKKGWSRWLTLIGTLLTIFLLYNSWKPILEGMKHLMAAPTGAWTWGGPNLFIGFGIEQPTARIISALLGILILSFLGMKAWKNPSKEKYFNEDLKNWRYHTFIQCSILLAATFLIRENYTYRLIFLMGMLPYIVSCANITKNIKLIRLWLIATFLILWGDWVLTTILLQCSIDGLITPDQIRIIWYKGLFLNELYHWFYFYLTAIVTYRISHFNSLIILWFKR